MRRPVIAQHDSEAGITFTADQPHFELFMAIGSDNRIDEIAVLDWLAVLLLNGFLHGANTFSRCTVFSESPERGLQLRAAAKSVC